MLFGVEKTRKLQKDFWIYHCEINVHNASELKQYIRVYIRR